jgi:hypothetical protein
MGRSWPWLAAVRVVLGVVVVSILALTCHAGNPFSSNVVALTAKNWKEEVLDYPHAVLVNICRQGWGYCQLLASEWEKLADKGIMKGTVKIAYWDTEQQGGGRRPPLLGEIKGTPTIRLYKPKKHQGNSHREKVVVDYNFERKAKDLKRFLDAQMPDFSEKINKGSSELKEFHAKAVRNGVPRAILFTAKSTTSPLTKYLSTEFRRRLLLAEVKSTKKENQEILDHYGLSESALPALLVFPTPSEPSSSGEPPPEVIIRYEGDGYTRAKLHRFLSEHALKTPVFPSKDDKKKMKNDEEQKQDKDEKGGEPKPKQKVHTEF